MKKKIKGPQFTPKGYLGMPGWRYHPRKGFKRDKGFNPAEWAKRPGSKAGLIYLG